LFEDDTINYTFSTPISLNQNGEFKIKTWISHPNETLNFNDTLTVGGPIYLDQGEATPLVENFSGQSIPEFWRTVSDDDISWVPLMVTQRNGFLGGSLTMAFEDYPDNEDVDYLHLLPLDFSDLSGTTTFGFDLAYSYNNTNDDGLLVEVSTDCGASFQDTIFSKFGADLATSFTSFKIPEKTTDWSRIELDLSAYNGLSKVMISKSLLLVLEYLGLNSVRYSQ